MKMDKNVTKWPKYIQINVCIQIYPNICMHPNIPKHVSKYVYPNICIHPNISKDDSKYMEPLWPGQLSISHPPYIDISFTEAEFNFCLPKISVFSSFVFLYFLCSTFCISVFPMFDISLADSKFNFRSPEIVKVLWYDWLHQLNMNGQESVFFLYWEGFGNLFILEYGPFNL